jgi:hypothetical protein
MRPSPFMVFLLRRAWTAGSEPGDAFGDRVGREAREAELEGARPPSSWK